ncbi:MAG: RNA polymerase sigma factor [Planctomycetota bacterium]
MAENSDSLVGRLRNGDNLAAEELVERYYAQIYIYMRRLGHSRQVSEELTQDIFLQAWHHVGRLRRDMALSTWIYRIASNASKVQWRRNKKRGSERLEFANISKDGQIDPDRIEQYEELCQMRDAVEQLPRKLRQTIVLHYMQELPIAEAAEAAQLSEGTFKSRLSRALRVLRKQMGPGVNGEQI